MSVEIAATSSEYIETTISAAFDPTGDPPQFAFVSEQDIEDPAEEDWVDGSWVPATTYDAHILIGPDGHELAVGTYQVWIRLRLGSETPVLFIDVLEIQSADSMDLEPAANLGRLRARLGDQGSSPMFEDSDLSEMLSMYGGDLNAATIEGWERKAAELSSLIDFKESGSDRPLKQKFDNAQKMVTYWRQASVLAAQARSAGLRAGTVGKPVNLRCEPRTAAQMYPWGPTTDVIRQYPTHRMLMPAILG